MLRTAYFWPRKETIYPEKTLKQKRLVPTLGVPTLGVPTLGLVVVILLAWWMGAASGGYSVGQWAPVALILAGLALIASLTGTLQRTSSRWGTVALGLFAAYTIWTFASLLWSPNRGDAWLGTGQTLLYLLAFWLALGFVALGASRHWVLVASSLGPAVIAALTLPALVSGIQDLFQYDRLLGSVGYQNGEAAFLLVPFWASVYLAGSRQVSPLLRGLVLAGATLSFEAAVLTQSRGAMVAMAVSLTVFFLVSGQRLRGFFALAPIALALLATFPSLNAVYLALPNEAEAAGRMALLQALPNVWLTAAGAGLYGVLWGLIDRRWRPSSSVTCLVGSVALAVSIAILIFGIVALSERVGNPETLGEQVWEAFKDDDANDQEQNRYLLAYGNGRYTLWRVAWEDFTSHPLLGIGTHNYEATYYQLREKDLGYVRQPHILPLEVLSERGIVGGALFFGFLVCCLGAGLWARFRHLGSEGKGQVGAMAAAIAYWFVHSSMEFFWQLPAVTLPAIVYLAMLVGPWDRVEAAPIRWSLRAVGVGVAVLMVAVVAPLYAADRYLAQRYAVTDPQEALTAVEIAQRFNPVDPWLPLHEAELAALIGDRARAEKAFSEAVRLNPEHYVPYLLQGTYYEQAGETEEALQSYRKALALNPLDEELDQRAEQTTEKIVAFEASDYSVLEERYSAGGRTRTPSILFP